MDNLVVQCGLTLDLFNMEIFYPSEIARLVLGYLKDEKCFKSWQTFLEESSNLEEYFHLYKKGRVYSTNVNGYSLLNILNEYCVLKSEALSNGDNKTESPGKVYHVSESEFFETIRKDVFIETTKNAVDVVFQKYLPSSILNKTNSSSPSSSLEVSAFKASDSSSTNKENQNCHNADISEKLDTKECSGKQNKVPAVTSEIKDKLPNRNINEICIQDVRGNVNSKSICALNITKRNNDVLEQLEVSKDNGMQSSSLVNNIKVKNSSDSSDFISRQINNSSNMIIDLVVDDKCDRNLHRANDKSVVTAENLPATNSECKVYDISPIESVQVDDVELEIIKEIKKDNFISRMQLNKSGNCQTNITTSSSLSENNNHTVNTDADNSNKVSVHQAAVHSVQSTVTQVYNSGQKVNSTENNSVMNAQTNDKAVEISQTVVCNVQNKVNQNNNLESNVKSSSDQASCNSTSPFLNQSAVVDKIPLDSTRFILPNYTSNGSFSNNNAQFYFILNSPVASNVSGTFLTLPGFQTNVSTPILPAVGTSVKSTEAVPVHNVSDPVLTVPSAVNGISLAASESNSVNTHGNFLTTSNVSSPVLAISAATVGNRNTLTLSNVSKVGTTAQILSSDRKPKIVPRVLKRVSYAEFSDDDTDPDESESPKPCKRKKAQRKGSPKKKTSKKDLTEQPGQNASVSRKCNADKKDFLVLTARESQDVQNGSKKKCSNKKNTKTGGNMLSNKLHEGEKTRYGATYSKFKNNLEGYGKEENFLSPSNPAAKSIRAITGKQVTDHGNPVSSLSSHHNNLQSISSKTESENVNHSALLNENRVLKVVLSDVFSEPFLEPDTSHSQCADSSDLVRQKETSDNHISSSEKLAVQSRRSPRRHKADTMNSCESKNIDTINFQQKVKETNPRYSSILTKPSPCNGKGEPNKNSSFDMTTAVLNSMEEARQLITNPKKHSKFLGTKEFELQNSLKTIPGKAVVPKSAFQREIRDICENTELTVKIIGNDGKDINLPVEKNSSLFSSLDVEKNHKKSSTNYSRKNDKKVTVLGKNVTSVLGSSESKKWNNLFNTPLEQKDFGQTNETKKIVPLKICERGSSDTNKAEKHIAISECIEEERLQANSVASLHRMNVNARLKTSVERKLNFSERRLDLNSNLHINNSVFSAKNNAVDEKGCGNCSYSTIFKAESDSFKSANIINDNSDFIHQTSETSVFSVLTSISANTKILDSVEKHNETDPHSDILGVSSIKERNTLNVIWPSTSNHPIDSQKSVLLPALLTNNLLTTCEKVDKVITETCTLEEKNTSTVLLSSSIS